MGTKILKRRRPVNNSKRTSEVFARNKLKQNLNQQTITKRQLITAESDEVYCEDGDRILITQG